MLGKYHPDGVHSRDLTGCTPLSVAMWKINADVVQALLDLGAEINLADDNERTPLSHGVEKIELMQLLVERGGHKSSGQRWSYTFMVGTKQGS